MTDGVPSIEAQVGDLVTMEVDAIVNSANTKMSLGGSRSVAGAILRATGSKVQDELYRNHLPVPLGAVVVTGSYGLKCKHILHVATHAPSSEERVLEAEERLEASALRTRAIREGVTNAILEARKLGARSVALPLLGTGALSFDAELSAQVLVLALRQALVAGQAPARVIVVVADEAKLDWVQRALAASALEEGAERDFAGMVAQGLAAGTAAAGLARLAGIGPVGVLAMPVVGGAIGGAIAHWRSRKATNPAAHSGDAASEMLATLREENEQLRAENKRLNAECARLAAALGVPHVAARQEERPLPAAMAYRLVESELDPVLRLGNLKIAWALLVRYFGALALADYAAAKTTSTDLSQELRKLVSEPSGDGRWLEISIKIAQWQQQSGTPSFLGPEVTALWAKGKNYGALAGALDRLRRERNADAHGVAPLGSAQAEAWLAKALPLFDEVLELAEPIFQFRLLSVAGLRDHTDDGRMEYFVKWLHGDTLLPRSEVVTSALKLQKRVYLMDPARERVLKLQPFLEYQPCGVTNALEPWSIDQVGDTVRFATFRFAAKEPFKVELPAFLKG